MLPEFSVLYVEDDPLNREIMELILVQGMQIEQVAFFNDSSDFMARLDNLNFVPNLILLDIHIRPQSGFELLNILRDDPRFRESRIVAMTASMMDEELVQLRKSRFDGVIFKPVSLNTFPDLVERILQGEKVWHIAS